MNFLAHLYLSGDISDIKIGNFIADGVRGKQFKTFSTQIQQGILLHRAIDAFTDAHACVDASITRLKSTQGRFAPVVIDIFYDHFLAKNWAVYHNQPLEDYAKEFYTFVRTYWEILPQRVREVVFYMEKQNWLYNYSSMKGMIKAFEGMSKRTKFLSNMLTAPQDLEKDYLLFEEDFTTFFPQLVEYSKQKLEEILQEKSLEIL